MKAPKLPYTLAAFGLAVGLSMVHAGCGPDGTRALNIVVSGSSSGTAVVSQPAGIACGSACAAAFNVGTAVTLNAMALDPYEFVGWEGACTGASPTCSLTMDDPKDVTASFRIRQVHVSLTVSGNGAVTSMPSAIVCPGNCSADFQVNTVLTLVAAPDSTAAFTGWGGDCTTLGPDCTLVLTADTQVTANFGHPVSCADLRTIDPTVKDGNRRLFVNGDPAKPWDAFCQMSVAPGRTYLNLSNIGANQNFSQYTAGGSSPGTSIKTNYTKIRIEPTTLTIDTNDQTFSTTTGGPLSHGGTTAVTSMPYASAMDCAGGGSATGLANIDLTGTPFAIVTGALAIGGAIPVGTTTPTPNGQIRAVDLTGGGNCGWNAPVGAFGPFNQNGALLSLVYFP